MKRCFAIKVIFLPLKFKLVRGGKGALLIGVMLLFHQALCCEALICEALSCEAGCY
jgi:hypothetical protein